MSRIIINQAIQEQKSIEFSYTNYNGESSRRRLSNIKYCNEFGEFGYHYDHISGYCHLRKEDRTFRISRISKAIISSTSGLSNPAASVPNPSDSKWTNYNSSHTNNTTTQLKTQNKSEGCYIATMVYGSYDHPEVLTLREFRDEYLAKYWLGKKFINLYYITSPLLVSKLKNHRKTTLLIKSLLEIFVKHLKISKK